MVYGGTSYNRIVCAAPPYGGLAYEKPQSGYAPLPQAQVCGFSPAHFARRWNCYAIPLSRRSKRRIQPERYAPFVRNCLQKYTQYILDHMD
jgi:hypothetical protein